jgi:hypothetical protein
VRLGVRARHGMAMGQPAGNRSPIATLSAPIVFTRASSYHEGAIRSILCTSSCAPSSLGGGVTRAQSLLQAECAYGPRVCLCLYRPATLPPEQHMLAHAPAAVLVTSKQQKEPPIISAPSTVS